MNSFRIIHKREMRDSGFKKKLLNYSTYPERVAVRKLQRRRGRFLKVTRNYAKNHAPGYLLRQNGSW